MCNYLRQQGQAAQPLPRDVKLGQGGGRRVPARNTSRVVLLLRRYLASRLAGVDALGHLAKGALAGRKGQAR